MSIRCRNLALVPAKDKIQSQSRANTGQGCWEEPKRQPCQPDIWEARRAKTNVEMHLGFEVEARGGGIEGSGNKVVCKLCKVGVVDGVLACILDLFSCACTRWLLN